MTTGLKLYEAALASTNRCKRNPQAQMIETIDQAREKYAHLLIQAPTGTGKSWGYLIPALASDKQTIIATSTLALQRQIASVDVPTLLPVVEKTGTENKKVEILSGRSNYACLQKVLNPPADNQQLNLPTTTDDTELSETAKEILNLRTWTKEQLDQNGQGRRDDAPDHSYTSWDQVSSNSTDCLGSECEFAEQCFANQSRARAQTADVVVTNHAMLATHLSSPVDLLPNAPYIVVDEAHDLITQTTSALEKTISAITLKRFMGKIQPIVKTTSGMKQLLSEFSTAVDEFNGQLDLTGARRISPTPTGKPNIDETITERLYDLTSIISAIMESIRTTTYPQGVKEAATRAQNAGAELAALIETFTTVDPTLVTWIESNTNNNYRLVAQPLNVAPLLASELFAQHTVVCCSATLAFAGELHTFAASVGLDPASEVNDLETIDTDGQWMGILTEEVFNYAKNGILYVPTHLPPPGRGPMSEETAQIIQDLIAAAGGRTLGLFSSANAAKEAAVMMRKLKPTYKIMLVGEQSAATLLKTFADDETSCLFGTLGLWQGVDVPGAACSLVIIDRIPFPRPDDPIISARSAVADRAGLGGFKTVSLPAAGVRLAQGAGRLIRSETDKGMVAVLDSRLAKATYSQTLTNTLPDFYKTSSHETAIGALKRLTSK